MMHRRFERRSGDRPESGRPELATGESGPGAWRRRRLIPVVTVAIAAAAILAGCGTTGPGAAPTPRIYYSVQKVDEGGHGGPPLIELPGALKLVYSVTGTCSFSMAFANPNGSTDQLPALTLAMVGPKVEGEWSIELPAGRYYPEFADAPGCLYSVEVRDPS